MKSNQSPSILRIGEHPSSEVMPMRVQETNTTDGKGGTIAVDTATRRLANHQVRKRIACEQRSLIAVG
jgi:hypothetical protein